MIVISIIFSILSIKAIFSGFSNVEMQEYCIKYGSEQIGRIAYYLNKLRFGSLVIWIVGLWIANYLKNKNIKSSKLIKILSITLLIITQLLPLGYTIFIKYGG